MTDPLPKLTLSTVVNTTATAGPTIGALTVRKPKTDAAKAKALEKAKAATLAANKNAKPPSEPDGDYRWNLPPHTWSLPVKPKEINPSMYRGKTANNMGNVPETYRRGRMWWYANTNNTYTDADGNPKSQTNGKDRKYGFQFTWNPEAFTTSVSLNTEVTPTPADRFASVAGAFPSGETISFTLRLDRTNDFACARNLLTKDYSLSLAKPSADNALFSQLAKYYNTGFTNVGDSVGSKIKTLMELGTLADIEYLYTAINGPGWKSVSGRKTGDIGYLSATLLRIDIGPLSYVGYVNSLSVNHIGFSQDMTPIRTDVQVSVNLMASAGIASDGVAAPIAPTGPS